MTREEHLELAKRIWSTHHQHGEGTCSCQAKPDAFTFLADLTLEQFGVYYIAARRLPVTAAEVTRAVST